MLWLRACSKERGYQKWQKLPLCAFCRTPEAFTDQEVIGRMNKCVERNEAISMEQLAGCYMNGDMGLKRDKAKAMELLEKAGENG